MFRFVVIEFVIIELLWWFQLLLLFLEPAEAKEEYIWSCSIIHTNNITLDEVRSQISIPGSADRSLAYFGAGQESPTKKYISLKQTTKWF
jgi:hypothetical protein